MVFKAVCILLLLFHAFLNTVTPTHILGIPLTAASHGMVFAKLGKELARRGFKYTLSIPKYLTKRLKPSTEIQNYGVRAFATKFEESDLENCAKNMIVDEMLDFSQVDELYGVMCAELLSDKAHFDELGHVDVVICDIATPCCVIVADMLHALRIDVSPMGFVDPILPIMREFSSPPAYVPQLLVPGFSRNMSFLDRTKNALLYMAGYATYHFVMIGRYKELKKKHAPNSPYQDWESVMRSSGLFLVQADFAFIVPRPLPPYVQVVGAILPEEPKPLPQEFIDVMATEYDIILVSMGTIVSNFEGPYIDVLVSAFARIPATIVWKHKGKKPPGLGNNTVMFPWIPQNDLLGHAKVKLFVSHCGINSLLEAAYHGVPVVGVPTFADQFVNAQGLQETGMGEMIKFTDLNTDDLTAVILKVHHEKSYQENAKRVSKKLSLPGCDRSGCVKLAADWVEYGIKNDGALHFRTETSNLSFIQLYLIDVIFFISVVIGAVAVGLFYICHFVFRICRKKSKTE